MDHGLPFQKSLDISRGLPLHVVRFLLSWYNYSLHEMKCVGIPVLHNLLVFLSVHSPVLFALYIDGLLSDLCVGCHWGSLFAGALCYIYYAEELAPCSSALRTMLSICNSYASSHGLMFNPNKTQLSSPPLPPIAVLPVFLSMMLNLITLMLNLITLTMLPIWAIF